MSIEIVIGLQWGDEGKGRFVDLLSKDAVYVARFAGGDNAGHTIKSGETVYKLHLLPSGLIYPDTIGILGACMVINSAILLAEIEMLSAHGFEITPERLMISHRAQLITPAHQQMDQYLEFQRGSQKIGTTGRGIGPAYTDKVMRKGIIFHDLLTPDVFKEKLENNLRAQNGFLAGQPAFEPLDIEAISAEYLKYGEILRPFIQDVGEKLQTAQTNGERVLIEGAQGSLLDIDHGSYPFVTSSSCLAANAFLSLGMGVPKEFQVTGVVKAFQSRVGEGRFPTELFDETSTFLRGDGSKQWDEFGTTTGRPRRVGWLDGVLLKRMIALNGVDALAMTKLDVLSGLETIKFCRAYSGDVGLDPLLATGEFEPVYESLPGWQEDLQSIRNWDDLPQAAQNYVEALEDFLGIPISWISVGPERSQVIPRR